MRRTDTRKLVRPISSGLPKQYSDRLLYRFIGPPAMGRSWAEMTYSSQYYPTTLVVSKLSWWVSPLWGRFWRVSTFMGVYTTAL